MTRTETRISRGGQVVEQSLRTAGFETRAQAISLYETAAPSTAYKSVLVQNAWTTISEHEFRQLVVDYGVVQTLRQRARRAAAAINMKRAERVVALTQYMGDLVEARGVPAIVAPVTLPLDIFQLEPRKPTWSDGAPFVLVPGTTTWYKGVAGVPEIVAALDSRFGPEFRIVLAGPDDGSGALAVVRSRLAPERVFAGPVSRAEMAWLLRHADATILLSRLESLSLSLGEALATSKQVFASRIPAHVEVANRFGRQPIWIDDVDGGAIAAQVGVGNYVPKVASSEVATQEWVEVGKQLGLPRISR